MLCTSYTIFRTKYCMISINTAETDEFIDITNAVLFTFSDDFVELGETLMNENDMEMPHDASSALELYIYLLRKIEEYN